MIHNSNIDVIGEAIYVNGEAVARINPDAPWRCKDDLTEFLREATCYEDEKLSEDEIKDAQQHEVEEAVHAALTDVLTRARKQAHAGLLSLGELSFILKVVQGDGNDRVIGEAA